MKIHEVEKLFKKEKTLEEVLEQCQEDFDLIDEYSQNMKNAVTDIPEEAKTALNKLTGVFMSLRTVYAIAETEKKNREIRAYETLRIDTENEGKKFVSSVAERQSSLEVKNYRRIKNIIHGYLSDCEKAISTLQSILKFMGEEMKLQGIKDG